MAACPGAGVEPKVEVIEMSTDWEALTSNGLCLAVAADGCAMDAAYSRKERLNDERRGAQGVSRCNNRNAGIRIEPSRFELGIGFPP